MDVHFFKPLLPEFKSGVDIPLSFFSKYMEEGPSNKRVFLSSDRSDAKWPVNLAGRRLTVGWEEFATAHDYKVGDILVFRYSGQLLFHVTPFGIKSSCELHYADDTDESQIVALRVTNDNLQRSRMLLPKDFTNSNGLSQAAGQTINLMNEDGVKWPVKLVMECTDSRQRLRLTVGLAEFLLANNVHANTTIRIKVIWENETTLVLKLMR